jgi:hypothetical protein
MIYYLKGTKGWGAQFGGRPTGWWKPQARTNGVGSATNNSAPVVGAHANPTSGIWEPLPTNTPSGGSTQFGDTQSPDDHSYDLRIQRPKLLE